MKKLILCVIVSVITIHIAFAQWTTSGNNIYNSNTGYVGIGTTTPRTALDVGGGVQISGTNSTTPSSGVVSGLFPYSGVGLGIYSAATSSNQGIGIWTNPGGTQKEAVRILSGGNVGIGTTTPSYTLNVDPNGAGGILIGNSNIGSGNYTSLAFAVSAKQNGYSSIQSTSSSGSSFGSLIFNQYGGSIGVGTTNIPPGYLMAVNGNFITNSITIQTYANWPDYVFDKRYKLPALTDVKYYLQKNHHLQDIPTAGDIEKNGLNLGELDQALVKKAEELTLYAINEDAKLKKQQKTINYQQEQINKLLYIVARLQKR